MSEVNKSFPFEVKDVDETEFKQLKNYFDDTYFNLFETRFGPKGYLLTKSFETIGRDIYNMEIRPTDIFVTTFPKSGTTWTQELVWLIANDCNFEEAKATHLNTRFPFIESEILLNADALKFVSKDDKLMTSSQVNLPSVELVNNLPSPRFLKSHLPLSLLPPRLLDTGKVVYVARDPRDVAVSFYHHNILIKYFSEGKDFKTYWNFFTNNLVSWTPFFEHIKEAWQLRHHPNILFLFYEELSKDLPECARRVAKFFNKEITNAQIQELCEHLKIDNFKKNKSVNLEELKEIGLINDKGSFIRKGKVGGWRNHFDEEMTRQAEQWIEDNLRDTDLRFPQ